MTFLPMDRVKSGYFLPNTDKFSKYASDLPPKNWSNLNEADQLFFDQIAEAAGRSESLRKAASVNSLEKFQLVFREVLESLFIERMELNEELFTDYMSKPEIQKLVAKWLGAQVYQRLTEQGRWSKTTSTNEDDS